MPKDAGVDGAAGKGAAPRRIGLATVARPCLVGALMLSALHVVLGH
jgi:hypothetical protein